MNSIYLTPSLTSLRKNEIYHLHMLFFSCYYYYTFLQQSLQSSFIFISPSHQLYLCSTKTIIVQKCKIVVHIRFHIIFFIYTRWWCECHSLETVRVYLSLDLHSCLCFMTLPTTLFSSLPELQGKRVVVYWFYSLTTFVDISKTTSLMDEQSQTFPHENARC